MKRRISREKAVQALYQVDMRGIDSGEAIQSVLNGERDEKVIGFLKQLVNGVVGHLTEIDAAITKYLRGWTIERLPYVDRAILRLAVFEICHLDEIPAKVAVNEAIELARAFGMDESVKYINGVLDKVVKEREREKEGAAHSE